jgi:hypothetical protein
MIAAGLPATTEAQRAAAANASTIAARRAAAAPPTMNMNAESLDVAIDA